MRRKNVIELRPKTISEETLQKLEGLVARVKAGDVTGLAWAEVGPAGYYLIDIAGATRDCPIYTSGLLMKLVRIITD